MHPLEIDFDFLPKIRKFAIPLRKTFDDLVIVGLGGSSLGTKALLTALGPFKKNVYFLDNLDPFIFHEILKKIKIQKTLFLVISKSGETIETLMLLKALISICDHKNIALNRHFVIITEEKRSPLFEISKREKLPFFPHPSDVPGRYSVFSPVTLIPATLLSIDTKKFCEGVSTYSKYDLRKLVSFAIDRYKNDKKTMVMFAYSERLSPFCDWATQLIAESLGKKREGITPLKAIGPKDQHSLLQIFLDGPSDKWFLFLSHDPQPEEKIFTKIIEKERLGVMKTFREKRKPFIKMHIPALSEKTLGPLFFSFMKFTVEIAAHLNVNPFDQPAVTRSKQITRQLL